jgi:hypothetical protein
MLCACLAFLIYLDLRWNSEIRGSNAWKPRFALAGFAHANVENNNWRGKMDFSFSFFIWFFSGGSQPRPYIPIMLRWSSLVRWGPVLHWTIPAIVNFCVLGFEARWSERKKKGGGGECECVCVNSVFVIEWSIGLARAYSNSCSAVLIYLVFSFLEQR